MYVRQPCIPRSDAKITHEVRLVFRWYNNKIKFTSAKKIEVCIVNSNVVGETYDSTINPFNDLITRRQLNSVTHSATKNRSKNILTVKTFWFFSRIEFGLYLEDLGRFNMHIFKTIFTERHEHFLHLFFGVYSIDVSYTRFRFEASADSKLTDGVTYPV